ncbi:DinB family protein [Streptomyces sp. CBMA156]|uniref:DinB family protein n=1 Tax=Streptomyces sp. CBMA156 TaxID=1930280 RepID=UPI001661D60F|nr:DinB family protein [Streptomyces sp. CBMA156]MBD0674228.1 Mini-circle protein [Streptomyces sp. CBMA156]MBD0675180.1 Mini-circle protein [Streptomyces sp. CBMA156]
MTELDPRVDPPMTADEAATLTAFLDYHRGTLALKCAGLTDDQLRLRSVPPSNLSLLGLVRHMAEVEQYWFQCVLLGQEITDRFCTQENEDGDFDDVDTADAAADFAVWQAEIEAARRAVEGLPLDTVGKSPRRGQPVTLRWILAHMVEEYARHNGHADLLRELVDGSTGE